MRAYGEEDIADCKWAVIEKDPLLFNTMQMQLRLPGGGEIIVLAVFPVKTFVRGDWIFSWIINGRKIKLVNSYVQCPLPPQNAI